MSRFGTTKRRPADITYSQYLRKLRGYRCEKCGARHEPNSKNLGVSHYWGRVNESTRYDDQNCDILCNIPCHQYFESHKTEYETWKRERIGVKAFKALDVKAHTYKKRDDAMRLIEVKELLKSLE